jgi:hypothetical protein
MVGPLPRLFYLALFVHSLSGFRGFSIPGGEPNPVHHDDAGYDGDDEPMPNAHQPPKITLKLETLPAKVSDSQCLLFFSDFPLTSHPPLLQSSLELPRIQQPSP